MDSLMPADIRDRTADALLALIPLYHKNVIRTSHTFTGLQFAQYHMLGTLMKHGTLPMSKIGQRLYISRPYMTALTDSLIAENLVERLPDLADRRVVNIAITEKGKKHLRHSVTLYKHDLKERLAELDNHDLDVLCTASEELQRILARIL
jgi:DNA-binding MarR family transcriptional regulator